MASLLIWARCRDWPLLDVAGEIIEGETAWRAWGARASLSALLDVRDRLADGDPA